jgi:hypothetical protein
MSNNAIEEVAKIRLGMLINGQHVMNTLAKHLLLQIEKETEPDASIVFEANILRSLGRTFWKSQMDIMEQIFRKYGETVPPADVLSEMTRTHAWLNEFYETDQKITSRFEELRLVAMEKSLPSEELAKMQSMMFDALKGKNLGSLS